MNLESKYNISNVTENLFQIRERIYSVTEVVTEELDEDNNPIIELNKKHIDTNYIEVKEDTDISVFPDFIQSQIITFRNK